MTTLTFDHDALLRSGWELLQGVDVRQLDALALSRVGGGRGLVSVWYHQPRLSEYLVRLYPVDSSIAVADGRGATPYEAAQRVGERQPNGRAARKAWEQRERNPRALGERAGLPGPQERQEYERDRERQRSIEAELRAVQDRVGELIHLSEQYPDDPETVGTTRWYSKMPPAMQAEWEQAMLQSDALERRRRGLRERIEATGPQMLAQRYPVVAAIETLTAQLEIGRGDMHWVTGDEWRARGEGMGENAALVLLIEGSGWYNILNGHSGGQWGSEALDAFYETARQHGYGVEHMHSWSVAFIEEAIEAEGYAHGGGLPPARPPRLLPAHELRAGVRRAVADAKKRQKKKGRR